MTPATPQKKRRIGCLGWLGIVALILVCVGVVLAPDKGGRGSSSVANITTVEATVATTASTTVAPTVESDPATQAPTEVSNPTSVPATEPPALPTETLPPINTPIPTNIPEPTATSEPIPVEPSHGLGMSRAAWEAKEGPSVEKGFLGLIYQNGFEVTFSADRAEVLERQWKTAQAIAEADAPAIGELFVPNDAEFVRTYTRDVTTIRVYHSAWLVDRFPADAFINADPGDFIIQYNVYDGRVTRLIISIGDNP